VRDAYIYSNAVQQLITNSVDILQHLKSKISRRHKISRTAWY